MDRKRPKGSQSADLVYRDHLFMSEGFRVFEFMYPALTNNMQHMLWYRQVRVVLAQFIT
jgi:hypothetical protein